MPDLLLDEAVPEDATTDKLVGKVRLEHAQSVGLDCSRARQPWQYINRQKLPVTDAANNRRVGGMQLLLTICLSCEIFNVVSKKHTNLREESSNV